MKNYSDLDRKINVNNMLIDRLALEDLLESGRSLTVGLDYNHLNKKIIMNSLKNLQQFTEIKRKILYLQKLLWMQKIPIYMVR